MMLERISCLENVKTKGANVYKEILGYSVVLDCPILPGAYKYHGILKGKYGCLLPLITSWNTLHFLTKICSSNFLQQS